MYKLMTNLSAKVAIDIGTTTTRIAIPGSGIVLCEATAVSVSDDNRYDILAVGNEAVDMCGRTPSGVQLRFPFKNGAIADFSYTEFLLKAFLERTLKSSWLRAAIAGTQALICVPSCLNDVERVALMSAARHAGLRSVYMAKSALCASIGAKLPYSSAVGSMIADIGGGKCDCAAIVLCGIAEERSVRIGGNSIDTDIQNYVRRSYALTIGRRCAEKLKHALANEKQNRFSVHGLCIKSGLPREVTLERKELISAASYSVAKIVECVCDTLAETPPELASDIMKNGITLCGGGAQFFGLRGEIEAATNVKVRVADKPKDATIAGAICVLEAICDGRINEAAGGYSVEV